LGQVVLEEEMVWTGEGLGDCVDDQTELLPISKMMESLGKKWHGFVGERSSTSQR
jgi:hypothetical protein